MDLNNPASGSTNINYDSVNTVLKVFKNEFNEDFYASRLAERKGVHKDDIIAEWREISKASTEYSEAFQSIFTRYLSAPNRLYSPRDSFEKMVVTELKDICDAEDLSFIDSKNLKPNHSVSMDLNNGKGISAESNVTEELVGNDLFNVWYVKTGRKFSYDNKYGEFFHFPLDHLSDSNYNDYCIRLSVYTLIQERLTGKKFNRGGILYWDKNINTFKLIPLSYMKKDAEMLIEFYKIK